MRQPKDYGLGVERNINKTIELWETVFESASLFRRLFKSCKARLI